MTITVDNASSNDCAIAYLKEKLEGCLLNGKFLHMRCVSHIINLVVKDGLKEYDDSISRARAAVKFIRQSPSRLEAFKKCVKECNIDYKGLLSLDCPTRWNSTFEMLGRAQKFEKAFNAYERQNLTYKLELTSIDGVPTRSDWQHVRHFASFLEVFYNLTKKISGTSYTTCNLFFDEIVEVDFHLRENEKNDDDEVLQLMASRMKEKFDKYWGKVEKMNMLLYVAVVVDPRYKMDLIEVAFEYLFKDNKDQDVPSFSVDLSERQGKPFWRKMVDLVDSSMRDIFNEYLKNFGHLFQERQESKLAQGSSLQHKSKMRRKLDSKHLEGNGTRKSELDRYLMEGREDDNDCFDILHYWKINSARFPVLSSMARDVLAIPISTVASESAFNTGGRVLDSFRSSLSPPLVEALICTQDWIRREKKKLKLKKTWKTLMSLQKNFVKDSKMVMHRSMVAVQLLVDVKRPMLHNFKIVVDCGMGRDHRS